MRFIPRTLLMSLMAIYVAGIGHATIVPIPIDDDLNIYIPCTDVSGSTETGGVTVTATPGGQSTISDASGNYKLLCLPIGTHTLTPTKASTTFVPATRLVSVPTAEDITIANISFNYGRTISGNVAVSGATLTLLNGSLVVGTTTSDLNGNYSFASLGPGSYEVQASKFGVVFANPSQSVTVGASNISNFAFAVVSITTPGVMPGQLAVNPNGSSSYSIPITVPKGTAGMQPSLALTYNSNVRDGMIGVGWSLSGLPSVRRCPSTVAQDDYKDGIRYGANDRYCLDGQRLIATSGLDGGHLTEYRTELETFSRIVSYNPTGSALYFVVQTKSGLTMELGSVANAVWTIPTTNHRRIFAINKVSDRRGNFMVVNYSQPTADEDLYPSSIEYTQNGSTLAPYAGVDFVYESRPDVVSAYEGSSAARIISTRRLSTIKTRISGAHVKQYRLSYGVISATTTLRSRLTSLSECDVKTPLTCLGPVMFKYQDRGAGNTTGDARIPADMRADNKTKTTLFALDHDGDGVTDLLASRSPSSVPSRPASSDFCYMPLSYPTSCFTALLHQPSLAVFTGDFDGDGKQDVYNFTTNYAYLYTPGNTRNSGMSSVIAVGDLAAKYYTSTGDHNGDGYTDFMMMIRSTSFNEDSLWCRGPDITRQGKNCNYIANARTWGTDYPGFVFTGDFDGDGKTDLILGSRNAASVKFCAGCIFEDNTASAPRDANRCVTIGAENWNSAGSKAYPGDFNGDGYSDLYIMDSAGARFCPGPGIAQSLAGCFRTGTTDWRIYDVYVGDYDGDSKSDLYLIGTAASFFCSGTKLWQSQLGCAQTVMGDWKTAFNIKPGDFDGDGVTDLYMADTNTGYINRGISGGADLLTRVTTSLGATTEITYRPLTDSSVYAASTTVLGTAINVQFPAYVVKTTAASNGVGGILTDTYGYFGARMDRNGRGFLGFEGISHFQPNGIYTTTKYRQEHPFIGKTVQTVAYQPNGQALNITDLEQSVQGPLPSAQKGKLTGIPFSTRYFVYDSTITQKRFDLTNQFVSGVRTTKQMDSYGNPTSVLQSEIDFNNLTTGNHSQTIRNFDNFASTWQLGLNRCTAVTKTKPDNTSQTRTVSTSYRADGLPQQVVVEPPTGCVGAPLAPTDLRARLIRDFDYDPFGNQRLVTESTALPTADVAYFVPRTTTINYDTRGQFPQNSINAAGHTESYQFDAGFNVMTAITAPHSRTTSRALDSLGRQKSESRPDGTTSQWVYEFCTGCGGNYSHYITQIESGVPTRTAYFDVLNRPYRTSVTGFSGQNWGGYSDFDYDSLGRVSAQYRPYVGGSGVYPNVSFIYDLLNRVTQESRPDGGGTVFNYNRLTTTATHSGSNTVTQATQQIMNGIGQLVSVADALGTADQSTTTYSYDPFGNASSIRDNKGNIQALNYDVLGRRTGLQDPDLGTWQFVFNPIGELVSQTDAKNQTSVFKYDRIGRPTQQTAPDLTSNWIYDTCTNGTGQLCEVNASNQTKRLYNYDTVGRLTQLRSFIDSTTASYDFDSSYDAFGRLATITYPSITIGTTTSRFALKYLFNANGYLAEVRNNQSNNNYWTATGADPTLQYTAITMGNGLSVSRGFDPMNGNLLQLSTGSSGAIQQASYAWDTLGNLRSRTDARASLTENFTYDAHNRLLSAVRSGASIGTKSYTYDAIGNLLTKSDVGTLVYPTTPVRPHSVTSVTGTINGVLNPAYAYDANGNMSSGAGRTLFYNTANLPWRIVQGATTWDFVYDAFQNRVKETVGTTSTVFVNAGSAPFYEKSTSGTLVTHKHYVQSPDGALAIYSQRSDATSDLKYLHRDHLGSVAAVTSSTGTLLERLSFDSWGKRRNVNGTDVASVASFTQRGFTDHQHLDAVGLVHMNGRTYDPTLARFTSADPFIPNPVSTQSYNRYAYVGNNPLSFTDPSGFLSVNMSVSSGGGGEVYELDPVNVTGSRYSEYAPPRERLLSEYERPLSLNLPDLGSSSGGAGSSSSGFTISTRPMVGSITSGNFGAPSIPVERTQEFSQVATQGGQPANLENKVAIGPLFPLLLGIGLTANEIATSDVPMIGIGPLNNASKAAGQIHHIATNKAIKSGYTKEFKAIFDKAGMKLNDPANKVFLEGHAGRHAPAYHDYILGRLSDATKGLSGTNYANALRSELGALGEELLKNPDLVKGVGLRK